MNHDPPDLDLRPVIADADKSGEAAQVHPFPAVRRLYVVALRDELPLPVDGWRVVRHASRCHAAEGVNVPSMPIATCAGDETCGLADRCHLIASDSLDPGFSQGMTALASVTDELLGRSETADALQLDPLPRRTCTCIVSAPWSPEEDPGDHFDRCAHLLFDCLKALRQATEALVPNPSLQRLWPVYAVVDEEADGRMRLTNLAIVHEVGHAVPTPGKAAIIKAERLLAAAWNGNPVETYVDFCLDAKRAAFTDGDYTECILKAAAAAEVLIKQTAWMLTWEGATELGADPRPDAVAAGKDSRKKPKDLIGAVLAPRLGGNWSSKDSSSPVGAWRSAIAQVRNAVIHRGFRPSIDDASAALDALDQLESHLADRLAVHASVYPRAAWMLVGSDALARRGLWDKVSAAALDPDPQSYLRRYLQWVEVNIGDALED